MRPNGFEQMLREMLSVNGISLNVTSFDGVKLKVGLLSGYGLDCSFLMLSFDYRVLEYPDRALPIVLKRIEQAMLALCEYPERFATRSGPRRPEAVENKSTEPMSI